MVWPKKNWKNTLMLINQKTVHMPQATRLLLFLCVLLPFLLESCSTAVPQYDYRKLAQASLRLGMDIDKQDNHVLYMESAAWLGVPYRSGGATRRGTDCSGLTFAIYQKVYRKTLSRNSDEQRRKDCHKVKKPKLREGDLVFFHNGRKKKQASHVGIYLKNDRFIHASTRQGVIISSLNEDYWQKHWLCGGRP